jgi:hypothetical protein
MNPHEEKRARQHLAEHAKSLEHASFLRKLKERLTRRWRHVARANVYLAGRRRDRCACWSERVRSPTVRLQARGDGEGERSPERATSGGLIPRHVRAHANDGSFHLSAEEI